MNCSFQCPECGIELEVDEKIVGSDVSCPSCNAEFHIEFDNETENKSLSFSKKLDLSVFTTGITIPVRHHEPFLKHLSVPLKRGGVHKVLIKIGDESFQTRINNIGFSDTNRKQVLAFLWARKSPIAQFFQTLFPKEFQRLSADKNNREGVTASLTVACDPEIDTFRIDLETDFPTQIFSATKKDDLPFFRKTLLREFPNGFQFNESSIRLLENSAGKKCPDWVIRELKHVMFKRYDGVFLLPEMVVDQETEQQIYDRILELFSQYGAFSTSVLFVEFQDRIKNLPVPESDFRLYLLSAVLPKLPDHGKIFGRQLRQICIPGDMDENVVPGELATRIHEFLRNNGDVVLIDDLMIEFPYLNRQSIEMLLVEQIKEAVEIQENDLQYWKLLEFFYLPDDFKDSLIHIVNGIEQEKRVPSLQVLSDEMDRLYGKNFRETYAVENDSVFQQVISIVFAADTYCWKNNLFVKRAAKKETNVADEFLQSQHGIFHESEFFQYAAEHRGLTNTGMLILTFLRNKCIRIDQTHWISMKDFDKQVLFDTEISNKLVALLNLRLAQKDFLPLGTLPNAFFSDLPILKLNDKNLCWNEYFLASIIARKIPSLRIINDEPSPYTVTAMLIPKNASYTGDVIEYIHQVLQSKNIIFNTADDVFTFLKENNVRMMKTRQLHTRISALWRF